MIQLLTITAGLCLCYPALFFILPIFFEKKMDSISRKAVPSILIILIVSFFIYYLNFIISNVDVANRVLHTFGGGFLAFLVCFLVVSDSKLKINKFQFFAFAFLLVTALGVTNEILEFILQNYTQMVMASNINDTWLDLISNTFGILIGGIIFLPFVNRKIDKDF